MLTSDMRSGIITGAVNGIHDTISAIRLVGFWSTGCRKSTLAMSSIITGCEAACASWSLFTMADTAANAAA